MRKWIVVFTFVAACAREEPAPPVVATTDSVPPARITTVTTAPTKGTYDEAMLWLKSAPSFRFVLDEGGVHAEGTMTRPTIALEKIEVRIGKDLWRAEAGARGVTWTKRVGAAWKEQPAPELGNRLYQRATLAFDPGKKEGAAQLVATEGASNHFRFTDANTGHVHDVWVSTADNHVERMTIGGVMEMTIQP